ncbi:MAG: hypothetical protein IPG64_20785 [Haliea sp.]|nr:hypothetical protein [Haliea sp.]
MSRREYRKSIDVLGAELMQTEEEDGSLTMLLDNPLPGLPIVVRYNL